MRRFFKSGLLVLLLWALPSANAEGCGYVFQCTNGTCERAQVTDCAGTSHGGAAAVAPLSTSIVGTSSPIGPSSSAIIVRSPAVTLPPNTSSTRPSYGAPCAENGSCYGDISTVNGTPKTIHVDGYYRKDGTYVRGHYRSRGSR